MSERRLANSIGMVQCVSPTEPGTGTFPKTALGRKTDAVFLSHDFTGNLTCDNYNYKTYQQQRSASLIHG